MASSIETGGGVKASTFLRVPTVCELARLGPGKAGPFVDDLSDAIATAMIGADEVTTRSLQARMDALTDAHLLYFMEQPKRVQDAEIARILGDVERMQLDAFATRFEKATT